MMNRKRKLAVAAVGVLAAAGALFSIYEWTRSWRTRSALEAVGPVDAASVPRIEVLLDDYNWLIREAAAKALGQIGPPARAAVPTLFRSLKDSAAPVRSHAAWALGQINPGAQAVAPLVETLADADSEVRRYAAFALSQLGPAAEEAVPQLIEHLPDPAMGYMAARALGAIGPAAKPSIPHLVTALRGDKSLKRLEYASALGKFGADARQAIPDLLPLTQDPDPDVRRQAALLSGEVEARSVEADLEKLLNDRHHRVRDAAAGALCKLGLETGVRELLELAIIASPDLTPLNALAHPDLWRRIRTLRWTSRSWRSDSELRRELGRLMGVPVGTPAPPPGSIPGRWPYLGDLFANPPTVLDLLVAIHVDRDCLIEDGAVRFVERETALRYWRRWWERRRETR